MTITLFITMFTVGSALCTLLTEAVKKAFKNEGKEASPNLLALIDAFAVGGCGTAVAYILLGIEWSINNIICLVLMIITVWIGSMVGWDKVKQMLDQLSKEGKA